MKMHLPGKLAGQDFCRPGHPFTKTIKMKRSNLIDLRLKQISKDEVLSGGKPIKGTLQVAWLHGSGGLKT